MALDFSQFTSTPAGYATPEQLASMREYAKLLQKQSVESPVRHWTQGVAKMVDALMGGYVGNRADAQQREALKQGAEATVPTFGTDQPAAPAAPAEKPAARTSYAPEATGDDAVAKSGGGTEAEASALGGIESGNRYDKLGPVITNGGMYHGDRAYGRYQVMGKNIPEWTQQVLGRRLTPQEFLASDQAQDDVFNAKFGEFKNKYGSPEEAASVWFTGRPLGKGGAGASDQLGTTGSGYVSGFAKALRGKRAEADGAPADALAFAGQPVASDAPVPFPGGATGPAPAAGDGAPALTPDGQAMVSALAPPGAGEARPGATGPGGTKVAQAGEWGPPVVPPSLVPHRTMYSRGQVMQIMQNPYVSDAQKKMVTEAYTQQFQPIQMPVTGGTVLINPANPAQQKFIPTLEKGSVKAGGIEMPAFSTVDPYGKSVTQLPTTGGGGSGRGAGGDTTSLPGLMEMDTAHRAEVRGAEETAGELSKAKAKPVAEAIETGHTAQNATKYLDLMEQVGKVPDAANINSGPHAKTFLQLKQVAKDLFGYDAGGVAPAEAIEKFNGFLAAQGAKELTSRPTQFDFKVFLERNPGIDVSKEGRQLLIDGLRQAYKQDIELSKMASRVKDPGSWADARDKYMTDHPIKILYRGREVTSDAAIPDLQGIKQPPIAVPNTRSLEYLRNNPDKVDPKTLRSDFDAMYGAGAADKYLNKGK